MILQAAPTASTAPTAQPGAAAPETAEVPLTLVERLLSHRWKRILIAAAAVGVFTGGVAIAGTLRPTTEKPTALPLPSVTATQTPEPVPSKTPMASATPAVAVPAPAPTVEPTTEPEVEEPAAPAPAPPVVAPPAPILVTVAGGVSFYGSYYGDRDRWTSVKVSEGTCFGMGWYSDLEEGATVTVYDAAGEVVAVTGLQSGVVVYQDPPDTWWYDAQCELPFSVQVPESSSYEVEIARRGSIWVDQADAGSIELMF